MRSILLLALLLILQNVYAASPYYFLCGSDEDGCPPGEEQYCAYIPASSHADEPYCLDFDKLTCQPLSEKPSCVREMQFANQARCLATIFQSEPVPSCKKVTESFCKKHDVAICNADGNPDSCDKI